MESCKLITIYPLIVFMLKTYTMRENISIEFVINPGYNEILFSRDKTGIETC